MMKTDKQVLSVLYTKVMSNISSKTLWEERGKRFLDRGVKGIGASVAQTELKAAARLWDERIGSVLGWTADIGAGNGIFWDYVKCQPAKLLLTDISKIYSQSTYRFNRLVADSENMPLRNESFNSIVALGLLEYIMNIEQMLNSWHGLVKPEGLLLLSNSPRTVPNMLRSTFGYGAIPRDDSNVQKILSDTGWETVCDPVRAGWQTLMVARKAVRKIKNSMQQL